MSASAVHVADLRWPSGAGRRTAPWSCGTSRSSTSRRAGSSPWPGSCAGSDVPACRCPASSATPSTRRPGGSRWRTGCCAREPREAALWQRLPGPVRPLWLNVSSAQVRRPGFVDLVAGIIAEHALVPGALGLEINETTLRALGRNAGPVLTDLHRCGAGLAIDNVGGWSDVLQAVDLLPVSALKLGLDQVQGPDLPRLERTAATVVREAGRRDLDVVAEGVDTSHVAERLTDLGCDSAHGWLYGSAQRADKVRWLLTQGPGWRGVPVTPGTQAVPGPRSSSLVP